MWVDYTTLVDKHTVVGDLRVARDVYSPQLQNRRDVLVWLPPGYADNERRYPVLYMHDGQNLFDSYTANFGEWHVDETMTLLAAEGIEAVIVGLPNMRELRVFEYCPYPDTFEGVQFDGQGDLYMRFIVETVKPLIDGTFRTLPERGTTGLAGSSMGGLISLYGFLMYPHIFGLCGAFSTAYWFGNDGLLNTVRATASGAGRVYLDVGTKEGPTLIRWQLGLPDQDAAYVNGVRALRDALLDKGYTLNETLMYVEDEGAQHNEAAWSRRLPAALRYLLSR